MLDKNTTLIDAVGMITVGDIDNMINTLWLVIVWGIVVTVGVGLYAKFGRKVNDR